MTEARFYTTIEDGVHVEITNLLVTGLNDSEAHIPALCTWMADNGLQDCPLPGHQESLPRQHLTR